MEFQLKNQDIGYFENVITLKYLIIVHVRIINFLVKFHPVWAYSLLYVYWFLRFFSQLSITIAFQDEILWALIENIDVHAHLLVKIENKLAKVPNNEFKMVLLSTWSPVCLLKFRPFPPCMIIPSCMFISAREMFLSVCLFHPVWLFGT